MKLFFLLLITMCLCSGCGNKYEKYLKNNTAEIRNYLFVGSDDNIDVSLISGKREKTYIVNGYATELVDFGVLTFLPKKNLELDYTIANYVLFVGTNKFGGALQKNPFDGSLVVDIKTNISPTANVSAKINIGEFSREIKLNCVNANWNIQSNDVYDILSKKFKSEIGECVVDKSFAGEVYIKILNDADENVSDYYWYVCILTRTGGRLSLIISPETGETLAINNLL